MAGRCCRDGGIGGGGHGVILVLLNSCMQRWAEVTWPRVGGGLLLLDPLPAVTSRFAADARQRNQRRVSTGEAEINGNWRPGY